MHVPDGYLSPSTCAALYAAALPFWGIAVRRIRKLLATRLVPLLSLFAAFSFVIMMFNLPLPGGTTGHAVGVGIAAVVLGPWASMLAISVALVIQALFFGDGGITAIGANCFNIAIVGSLVAHVTYRFLAGNAEPAARRRVVAAAIAGYAAINAAAILTAIEFGVQPMLFVDAAGAPLYAPYPLAIALPAMMIGHLTFAGLAEAIVSGGIVAFLQRSEPSLLSMASKQDRVEPQRRGWFQARPLWVGLCAVTLATPLGMLVAGTAWGEWSASDFADPAARAAISAGSLGAAAPVVAPAGLRSLASFWTSPIPDYAPSFLRSEPLGYLLSAMFGVGLILLTTLVVRRLAVRLAPAKDDEGAYSL